MPCHSPTQRSGAAVIQLNFVFSGRLYSTTGAPTGRRQRGISWLSDRAIVIMQTAVIASTQGLSRFAQAHQALVGASLQAQPGFQAIVARWFPKRQPASSLQARTAARWLGGFQHRLQFRPAVLVKHAISTI